MEMQNSGIQDLPPTPSQTSAPAAARESMRTITGTLFRSSLSRIPLAQSLAEGSSAGDTQLGEQVS